MKRQAWLVFVCVLALVSACGRRHGAPVEPSPPPPPEIEAVYPTDRARSIVYDTTIWAQFRAPLDPTTVNDHTVFLKLDTRRIPCSVSYEAATRRIRLTPQVELVLRRTHTVEISSSVQTADGASLSAPYTWQFTTIAVRVPAEPLPSDQATDESPAAALLWTGTGPGVGALAYDVYVGDSVGVATHAVTPRRVTVAPRLLASPHWDFSTSVYWAVTAHNLDTGESLDGPVWHFTTLPASTPIDSLVLPVLHWSTVRRIPSGPTCNSSQLALGPDIHSVCRWGTEDVDPNLKLAGVALRFVTGSIPSPGSRGVAIWATTSDWPICQIVLGGPPFADEEVGQLAAAEITFVNNVPAFFRLNSDALTSHVEAGIRHHRLYGYEFRAQLATNLTAPSSNGTNSFTVYYYRLPEPAARLSHAPTIANRRGAAPRATAQRGGSR